MNSNSSPPTPDDLLALVKSRNGHFALESGHHGDLWLNLDTLFYRPALLQPWVQALAKRLAAHKIDAVCGPASGGAFLAYSIACELGADFCYAERITPTEKDSAGIQYKIPSAFHQLIEGKRIAIVDDVINAGHAVSAVMSEVTNCGATCVAVSALLVLQTGAKSFTPTGNIPLEKIASLSSHLWSPAQCPLCASGTPLENPGDYPT